jgi:methylated-DNA-[protein]-cysteine S-methyltransferase
MALLITSTTTPVGTLNLIADGELLLGANLGSIKALKEGLDSLYRASDFKEAKKIPVISDLIDDYFDGDLSAINGIKVSQPGGSFSQAAWKAMRRIRAGKVLSYAELAKNSACRAPNLESRTNRNSPSSSTAPATWPVAAERGRSRVA